MTQQEYINKKIEMNQLSRDPNKTEADDIRLLELVWLIGIYESVNFENEYEESETTSSYSRKLP